MKTMSIQRPRRSILIATPRKNRACEAFRTDLGALIGVGSPVLPAPLQLLDRLAAEGAAERVRKASVQAQTVSPGEEGAAQRSQGLRFKQDDGIVTDVVQGDQVEVAVVEQAQLIAVVLLYPLPNDDAEITH